MNTTTAMFLALAIATPTLGCSFTRRAKEDYRADVTELLGEATPAIDACYAQAQAANPTAQGDVALRLIVGKRSGRVVDTVVIEDSTTAPVAVSDCVRNNIEGLGLSPYDQRQANGTFVWRFRPEA